MSGIESSHEFIYLFENSFGLPIYSYCFQRKLDIISQISYEETSHTKMSKIIEIINRRVNSDYHDLKDLNKEIVGTLNITERHVVRSIKLYGKTPSEIYRLLCLEKAKYLLITTSQDLEKIACRCGYSSAGSLSDAFKKYVGISPRSFRQKYGSSRIYFDLCA